MISDTKLHKLAFKALKEAVRKLKEESIKTGKPLIVMYKDKVVRMYLGKNGKARKIVVLYPATTSKKGEK